MPVAPTRAAEASVAIHIDRLDSRRFGDGIAVAVEATTSSLHSGGFHSRSQSLHADDVATSAMTKRHCICDFIALSQAVDGDCCTGKRRSAVGA